MCIVCFILIRAYRVLWVNRNLLFDVLFCHTATYRLFIEPVSGHFGITINRSPAEMLLAKSHLMCDSHHVTFADRWISFVLLFS